MHDSDPSQHHATSSAASGSPPMLAPHGVRRSIWRDARKSLRRRRLWLAFGFWLPILCFAVDHAGTHIYGGWTSPINAFVGVELALFAWFAWRRPRSEFVLGGMFVAFILGACFAFITGLMLIPWSLIGCIALIGALGLVPFGTCVAFGFAAQSVERAMSPGIPLPRVLGGVLATVILIGLPTGLRRYELAIAREALAAIVDDGDHARARTLLARLPSCDTDGLPTSDLLLRDDLTLWMKWSWADHLRHFPLGYS